jgi:hypothetical protein
VLTFYLTIATIDSIGCEYDGKQPSHGTPQGSIGPVKEIHSHHHGHSQIHQNHKEAKEHLYDTIHVCLTFVHLNSDIIKNLLPLDYRYPIGFTLIKPQN